MATLQTLSFDNSYARLPAEFWDRVAPTPVPDPYLVAFNPTAAALIDLPPETINDPHFVPYFAGNDLLPGSEPVAMKYAGHQFGVWVPQLGDGRAILLGEVVNARGERWDLHLKGAGKTAFSRFGDGRAVLRSTIREYLACEAMHALGIPTTRALCIVGTDMEVYRERVETGALLVRMAPSHVRFGSFEVFSSRNQPEQVKHLADFTIATHFPHLQEEKDKYLRFYREVIARTARLMADWQAVGFAHGVMNTDNMSILGLTIDYGPYGFMEDFNSDYICNHSDAEGRYAFSQQPRIGFWNLACLGRALNSLLEIDEVRASLDTYAGAFNAHIRERMSAKLGFTTSQPNDDELWIGLMDVLSEERVDSSIFFRKLSQLRIDQPNESLRQFFKVPVSFDKWSTRYIARLKAENSIDAERAESMNRANPKYILRNYLAQVAIEKAERKDFSEVNKLFEILQHPFDEQPEHEAYAQPAPDWGKHLEISCSS
jgi:uncharacterized protein YdiU (UPF0061 family)